MLYNVSKTSTFEYFTTPSQQGLLMKWPKFIAHRGASAIAPENSLLALHLAIDLGAKCVEFDVQPTQDNQLVVFHDQNLLRSSNNPANIFDLTLESLVQTHIPYHFNDLQNKQTIPTFDQYLDFLVWSNIDFNCEIKCFSPINKHTVECIKPYLEKLRQLKSRCLITSSCQHCLKQFIELDPTFFCGIITRQINKQIFKLVDTLKLDTISCHSDYVTSKIIEEAERTKTALMAYTVNNYLLAQQLLSKGVTSIFSDVIFTEKC